MGRKKEGKKEGTMPLKEGMSEPTERTCTELFFSSINGCEEWR